jgi:hypothetical protein
MKRTSATAARRSRRRASRGQPAGRRSRPAARAHPRSTGSSTSGRNRRVRSGRTGAPTIVASPARERAASRASPS